MPQFDFSTFATQIFWLAVTFSVLYFLMARKALPRIREVLLERQDRISTDIEKAEAIKQEAEAAKLDYASVLTNSRAKAKQIITEAEAKVKHEVVARHAKLDETLARQTAEAEALVAKTREETLQKLIPVSADLTHYILDKIAGKQIESTRIQAVVTKLANETGIAAADVYDARVRRFG